MAYTTLPCAAAGDPLLLPPMPGLPLHGGDHFLSVYFFSILFMPCLPGDMRGGANLKLEKVSTIPNKSKTRRFLCMWHEHRF